jgi:hypothetical protein
VNPGGPVDVTGTWDLVIRTPIGRQDVVLTLQVDPDGSLTGHAVGSAETVPLDDIALDGDRLTWQQSITRPLRLTLRFDVTITGDHLAGTSKAGRLPTSRVNGHRNPHPDTDQTPSPPCC